MEVLALLIPLCGVAGLFVAMWFLVTRQLRAMSGMAKELVAETGVLLRNSSWKRERERTREGRKGKDRHYS